MLLDEEFGDAGRLVVVEDFLEGREFSILTVVSEQGLLSLPVAQDYKRVGDGDTGENTGGMGTYSPVPWVTTAMVEETEARIVRPIVDHLRAKGVPYSGVLFSGVMVVDGSPYCLEYNVRFGDPETQSVMRRVEGLGDLLWAAAQGEALPPVRVTEPAAVTVVAASAGYPATSQKGVPITLGEMPEGVVVFHAGTGMQDGQLVTNGGRVLAVSAVANDLEQARARAYAGMDQVAFAGKHFRSDIGH
jgi:phosphoribosylamine--glycine ligase